MRLISYLERPVHWDYQQIICILLETASSSWLHVYNIEGTAAGVGSSQCSLGVKGIHEAVENTTHTHRHPHCVQGCIPRPRNCIGPGWSGGVSFSKLQQAGRQDW